MLLSLHAAAAAAAAAREGTERETVSKKCRLGGFCLIGSVSTRSLHPPNKGKRRTETETDPAVCNVPARFLLYFFFFFFLLFCYFYVFLSSNCIHSPPPPPNLTFPPPVLLVRVAFD